MNVISSDIAFDDFYIILLGKFLQDVSDVLSNALKKYLLSVFWYYHDMVRAVPLSVSKLLIALCCHSLEGWLVTPSL